MDDESTAVALELLDFGAADIERLTGVSRDMQRDWRRRGLIAPITSGGPRGRHHVGDLVKYDSLCGLAGIMGGPGPAAPVAATFWPAILARVMSDERAWADDSTLTGPREVRVEMVMAALGQSVPPDLAFGLHCGKWTIAARDLDEGRQALRELHATGLLVTIDFDQRASRFVARAKGQPFAKLAQSTPAEESLLNLSKGVRLQ